MEGDLSSTFARACALAIDREADFVLIPGDLFDFESIDPDTVAFVMHELGKIAPIPVFITPGNHDCLLPKSPYSNHEWPANVHIFTAPEFETVTLDALDCSITGIAHAHKGVTTRMLSTSIPPSTCSTRILLFHGSRDGYRPSEKETVIPFSDSELLNQSFTYAAIGHYHSFCDITDTQGHIRAAYSGCAQGRGLDETGEKYVLVGEIDPEGHVTLEQIEVAERRIVRIDVDITGSRDQSEIYARIDDTVSKQAREQDALHVFLKGTLSLGMEIDASAWESRQPYFSAHMNTSAVEPDYDLDTIARESAASPLRSAFVQKMRERQQSASIEEERRMLRDAIYYGLYALDGRRLEPRDAD